MSDSAFLKISRRNGETFYFNLQHVSLIYDNPNDKSIYVTGTGFEKKFRPDEAAELMANVQSLCVGSQEAPVEAVEAPAEEAVPPAEETAPQ